MLSPDLSSTRKALAVSFQEMHQILGYAKTTNTLSIGFLKPDPAWLASVRSRVSLLSNASNKLVIDYPDIWAPVLVGFKNYTTTFSVIRQHYADEGMDAQKWIALFKSAESILNKNISSIHDAITLLNESFHAYKNIQPLLDESIKEGWETLSNEEQQVLEIYVALTRLQDEISSLEDSLTIDALSGGKDAVQTSATIIYDLLTAAEMSIPFLAAASLVFTIGKTFYEVIHTTDKVNHLIEEVGKLQLEASHEAQALAGTKLVLQMLYKLELNFNSLRDNLPAIHEMWVGELGKIQAVIEALESGVDPNTYMEIQSLPMANATWQSIEELVDLLKNYQFTQGPPVSLSTNKQYS
jgi:hypothetical protein